MKTTVKMLILVVISMLLTNCVTHRYRNFAYMETSTENYEEYSVTQAGTTSVCSSTWENGTVETVNGISPTKFGT